MFGEVSKCYMDLLLRNDGYFLYLSLSKSRTCPVSKDTYKQRDFTVQFNHFIHSFFPSNLVPRSFIAKNSLIFLSSLHHTHTHTKDKGYERTN